LTGKSVLLDASTNFAGRQAAVEAKNKTSIAGIMSGAFFEKTREIIL